MKFKDNLAARRLNRIIDPSDTFWPFVLLSKRYTGLPYDIFVNHEFLFKKFKYPKPLVLVYRRRSLRYPAYFLPMHIHRTGSRIDPRVIQKFLGYPLEGEGIISEWITKNYDLLMRHYYNHISGTELVSILSSLEKPSYTLDNIREESAETEEYLAWVNRQRDSVL